jgi:YaiO family outer membrane protein
MEFTKNAQKFDRDLFIMIIKILMGLCGITFYSLAYSANQVQVIQELIKNQQYLQAIKTSQDYLQKNPDDGDAEFLMANAYWLNKNTNQAIQHLQLLLKKYPNYSQAHQLLKKINQSLQASTIWHQPPYLSFMDLYQKNNKQAIQKARDYLIVYPNDADVGLALAKMLRKLGQIHEAENILVYHLMLYPHYTELYLELINLLIEDNRLSAAQKIASLGGIFNPWNQDIQKKQKDIIYLQEQKHIKIKNTSIDADKQSQSLKKISISPQYLNEIGIYQQNYFITDIKQTWDYTTVFYGRQTQLGKLYGKVNYANRLHHEAAQAEVEFFPKLNDYVYLDLDATTANQPILFPRYAYSGEAFFVLPKILNVSTGAQMNRITNKIHYSRFTLSASKDISVSNITFRPYFYLPGEGASSILYTVNYRYNYAEPYGYMGFVAGIGNTPDFANLETINALVLTNKILSPYINFAIFKERLIINLSLLYQNQVFPNQRVRDWLGGTAGATWKF